jgi:hypothetical protein
MQRAACRSWCRLAEKRIKYFKPYIPLSRRFCPKSAPRVRLPGKPENLYYSRHLGNLLGTILVVILVVFLLGGFSGRFGGYVSKEEDINSSDTQAVRQFDTNQLYLLL